MFILSVSCSTSNKFNISQHYPIGLESAQVRYCPCYPAPLQLLQRGLFPCTPTAPTLAVDLKVLEFVRELFLRVAPNNTAWCDALESFLDGRKYKMTTRVSYRNKSNGHILFVLTWYLDQNNLRRRFGNALLWYNSLVDSTNKRIQDLLATHKPDRGLGM